LRPMFSTQVAPLIRAKFPLAIQFVCRTLKTTGLGESLVEGKIAGPLRRFTDAGLEIGLVKENGTLSRIRSQGVRLMHVLPLDQVDLDDGSGPVVSIGQGDE